MRQLSGDQGDAVGGEERDGPVAGVSADAFRPRLAEVSAGSSIDAAMDQPCPQTARGEGVSAERPRSETPPARGVETDVERCDRNFVELMQEVRVVQTGVQVLFGFLLMAPMTPVFQRLDVRQRVEYCVTFALVGMAAFLLTAPTAYHRVLFRRGDKEYLVTVANRLTIAGLGAVGLAMAGATVFVSDVLFGRWPAMIAGTAAAVACIALWAILPLARRRELERRTSELVVHEDRSAMSAIEADAATPGLLGWPS
jgi:hypothetical protein